MNADNNPFEEIAPKDVAPKSLKKEVMNTISFTHLLTQVADLFTVKMSNTIINMVHDGEKKPESSEEEKEDIESQE